MSQFQMPTISVAMVGLGMIFEETYLPFFRQAHNRPLYDPLTGPVAVQLHTVVSRTGQRLARYRHAEPALFEAVHSHSGTLSTDFTESPINAVCVATPDDRHFDIAAKSLQAGKHVLIEKPSVLSLQQLDELQSLAEANQLLAKVVYHKLADPDHKKLRTHVLEGNLKHVNNGYCTLLEPKSISQNQFAEWIVGRNPGTYVAVHYLKLIDFTFDCDWQLSSIRATGQRGLVSSADGNTWDSVQLQVTYIYPDGREATFDIHTNWVTPDQFSGYVEQEVQFRFDNGLWLAHQRKRGVELVIEDRTPGEFKATPNHHYNTACIEPWGEKTQRGYGIEIIERFFREVAFVEHGGPTSERTLRLAKMRHLRYNDISADRNCVAIIQSLEAILAAHANGKPGGQVIVNHPEGGLVLLWPGQSDLNVLYQPRLSR